MCEVVRFDHVTLAPVQAASAVATDTPPLPLAFHSKLACGTGTRARFGAAGSLTHTKTFAYFGTGGFKAVR